MIKVLVVDDVAIIRDPIAASLRLAGFRSLCAADGEEALVVTRRERPDVILLDVSMPKMDGLSFLKALRSEPEIAHTRVILLTAMSEKKYVIAALTLGVRDYLLKSRFRLADLIDRIKKPAAAPASPASPPRASAPASVPASAAVSAAVSIAVPLPVPAPQLLVLDPPAATRCSPLLPSEQGGAPPAMLGDDEIPQLLTRERFMARLKEVFKSKTLSGIVAQVIALASSPRGEMAQLATLIAQDPMLSVRVLQTANSASYSTGVAVTTIPDAIRKLGFTNVRNVAAALGVFDCMPEVGADGFDPIRCWQHSFAVAQLCERLATTALPEQSGLAYVVGLCHDLGDIFVRTQFGDEYRQVMEMAARTGRSRDRLHGLMLGLTETQMIAEVLKTISLPPAIREPIEILHSPKRHTTTNPLARILWMAENLANGALIASNPNSEIEVITQVQCKAAAGVTNTPPLDPVQLRAQVLSLTITLARLSRSDEAKLLIPMFAPTLARIWIARAPDVAVSDPVSLAVVSLAEATVKKRLPELEELDQVDAIIVLSPSPDTAGLCSHEIAALLAKATKAGRTVATLNVSSAPIAANRPASSVQWRTGISLTELASFVENVAKAREVAAAA